MKKYITIMVFSVFAFAKAQTIKLDTIYANDKKNVALFFPEPIRQGITGASHFVFTYNREKEQHFGLLQAQPGNESNLLVISKNGAIFSYIVKYRKELKELNHFIAESASIGNEIPKKISEPIKEKPLSEVLNRELYYQRFCSYLLTRKTPSAGLRKRNNGVVMEVENIVFDREELYFVIKVKNKSTLDYDINFLNFSVDTRKKGRKKSLQRLHQAPLYRHLLPERIEEGKTTRVVYVLPKFSLSDDRLLLLRLNENKGERNIELKIPARNINNPN
ncbi:DUF4138 domain-containing protein [Flagellimonas meridianipacifica]|uniref:Uncharacterized protein DUF4138 n=1 Tax=Flagellimonas meridianipacifica TaxID=1080225 RepID=A0A2T0M8V1_9FLAO|nr:DUF4138 domain-containing protein [Allomuricauda pacifica]PRX53966.1 uncharacterized protein DUF4138 [Allomuricauda pacifica]